MNRLRITTTALLCASLMTLAACGGEGSTTATESAAPTSSAAPAESSAPESSAPAAATGGASDKELCESAKKIGDDSKAEIFAALGTGKTDAAVFKKALTDMNEKLTALVATGGDSKVTAALKQMGAEAAKAAAAADPTAALENPAFEKAGKDVTAACKAVGVNANF